MNLYRCYYFEIKSKKTRPINESFYDSFYTEEYFRYWEKYLQQTTPPGFVLRYSKLELDTDSLEEVKVRWKGVTIWDMTTENDVVQR